MIARLSVAPETISDLSARLPAIAAKAQHETFIRAVEAHGLLVVASAQEEQDLLRQAKQLGVEPPGARERWVMALAELRKRRRLRYITPPIEQGLDAVEQIDALRDGWGGRAQVAVLASEHAAALGVTEGGLLVDPRSKLEIAAAPVAAYCETLNALRELAEQGELPHGAPRDDFWREVLMPLAVLSGRVVVLDQYLFGDLVWHHSNLPRSRGWAPEIVVWLLKWLDRTLPRHAEVVLIGGCGGDRGPRTAADVAVMIRDVWPQGQPPSRLQSTTRGLVDGGRTVATSNPAWTPETWRDSPAHSATSRARGVDAPSAWHRSHRPRAAGRRVNFLLRTVHGDFDVSSPRSAQPARRASRAPRRSCFRGPRARRRC